MQTLANYDPYAIEQIEFFVQKKSKYTSLKSIIVTLAILGLTVILNMNAIQHLWLKRSQLPLVSTSRKMSLQKLTSSYFCAFPKSANVSLPKTALVNYHYNTNETIKTFSVTDMFKDNPQVANISAGRESICYDLQGALITKEYNLKMILYSTDGNEFDFMFKTYSTKQIIGDEEENPNYLYIEGPTNANAPINYRIQIKKISAIYYDRLLIDYEPEQVFGFSNRIDYSTSASTIDASQIDIFSQYVAPFDLTDQYTLTRDNIAEILGRVISWFTVFVLICAFGVSPILDFNYKLQLAQKLYDNQKLNSIDLSILSYFKYLLSKIKKKMFNEDVLETAFQQLQKDLDLLNLIKRQSMMKKLIKENETLNIPHKQVQNRVSQLNMDFTQVLLSKDIALQTDSQNQLQHLSPENSELSQCPLITDPDEQSADNFFTSLIKSFDISEVEISLISNKGEGYKTSWNTIITVLFLCGVFWFILFAGLFELSPNYSVDSVPLLHDDSLYPTITLNPEDIMFRLNKSLTARFNLSVVLIDKYDNIIQTIDLLNGTDCDQYVLGMNETVGGGWLCLNQSITLPNNGINDKVKLGMRIVSSGFGFIIANIQIKLVQYNIIDHNLEKSFVYIRHLFSSSMNYVYSSQVIIKEDQQTQHGQDDAQAYWTMYQYFLTSETMFKGISFDLSPQFIRIKKTTPNIWDVIGNAWGIVVVAFSVFLSKITRYLNVKQRQKITQNQQNENRNDIVAIISTQYKLISTVFYDELKQVKYFYKTKMNELQIKEN